MNKGNGAREKIIEYFEQEGIPAEVCPETTDHFIAWLWVEGFKIVPLTGDE
jgi:hypothetical protein